MYEYLVLTFNLSLSPRVFVKCTEAAIVPLRERGMRLATYIDDFWLLATQSPQEAQAQTSLLVSHLMSLGFTINVKKSVLVPTRNITFIGLCLDSVTFKARLPQRVEALQACLALFHRGTMLKFKMCLRLLGLMASVLVVILLGRLHMRPVQR